MKSVLRSPFFKVFNRELDRMSKGLVYAFVTVLAPLLAYLIIIGIFSRGVPRDLPITVVDRDNTELSQKIIRMIDATPIAAVKYRCHDLVSARKLMQLGKTDAIILIQNDTEKDIYKGRSANVIAFINNVNVVKGGLLYSGLFRTISTISAGIKLNMVVKSGAILPEQAMAQVMPVRMNTHILFNPFANYSYFLTTSLLPIMLIVFSLFGSIYAFGIELKEGTGPEWLKTAHESITIAIAGKMFPYTILFMAQACLMNYLIYNYLGTPIRGSLGILLLSEFIMILSYQFVAILFLALTRNLRLSLSLGSAYSMMALTFSGLTFPTMGMPLIAKIYSYIFPFTYWLKIFISQSLRGEPVLNTIYSLCSMVVFILISMLFVKRYKKELLDEKYWGHI